jgi:hypothetical protein
MWPLHLLRVFPLFWCLDDKGGEDSYLYAYHFSFQCVMDMSRSCVGCDVQEPF